MQFVWQTSWGVSTRLLGAIVMAHGDDQGLRLPPTVASTQAVIVPIFRKPEEGATVLAAARKALEALIQAGIRARIDEREGMTPGFKFNDWEMRGVPVRIEIGPRDVASGEAVLARRDKSGPEAKSKASIATIAETVSALLGEIQKNLYAQAKAAMVANTRDFDDYATFRKHMEGEGGGGFAHIYWCGNPVCETKIREETKATCRAMPIVNDGVAGKCLVCGESATERAYFAKSY
jgi:prolyl-tRNA synthetase